MLPRSGDVVLLDRRASPQFAVHPVTLRVVRVLDWKTNDENWCWLDGYQLDVTGDAVERRSLYVSLFGIVPLTGPDRADGRVNPAPTAVPMAAGPVVKKAPPINTRRKTPGLPA